LWSNNSASESPDIFVRNGDGNGWVKALVSALPETKAGVDFNDTASLPAWLRVVGFKEPQKKEVTHENWVDFWQGISKRQVVLPASVPGSKGEMFVIGDATAPHFKPNKNWVENKDRKELVLQFDKNQKHQKSQLKISAAYLKKTEKTMWVWVTEHKA
jgi:hypothetical protein